MAGASSSPRGAGRGRGLENFFPPPLEKLSFLCRTISKRQTEQSRKGKQKRAIRSSRSKKFPSPHKRHTCRFSALFGSKRIDLAGVFFRLSRNLDKSTPFLQFSFPPQSAILEAASARMAARDRFGAYVEPGLTPLQRAIRKLNAGLNNGTGICESLTPALL